MKSKWWHKLFGYVLEYEPGRITYIFREYFQIVLTNPILQAFFLLNQINPALIHFSLSLFADARV